MKHALPLLAALFSAVLPSASRAAGLTVSYADVVGLSQDHICFARINGGYRIPAVFGYGF